MIKIAGTLPVKSRLPLSAWLLAALVTLFSLMHAGTMSEQAVSVSEQAAQESQQGSVLGLLARFADVLTSPG
jgi:hypothetical protein